MRWLFCTIAFNYMATMFHVKQLLEKRCDVMKKSANQQEYSKHIKRLQAGLKRSEKRGYLPDYSIIPTIPKRVTKKALEKIKKTKPKDIYGKGLYVDRSTGEIVTGAQGLKLEKDLRIQKAKQTREAKKVTVDTSERGYGPKTIGGRPVKPIDIDYTAFPNTDDIIISNFLQDIALYPNMCQPLLSNWLNNTTSQQGKHAVAQMLEDGKNAGLIVTYKIAYSKTLLMNFISEMLDYLPDIGELEREQIIEAFENEEDWESV